MSFSRELQRPVAIMRTTPVVLLTQNLISFELDAAKLVPAIPRHNPMHIPKAIRNRVKSTISYPR
jgi:hypothetical protein